MDLLLGPSVLKNGCHIVISGSKSETNRLLLLQALFSELKIENASDSDDSKFMVKALSGNDEVIDVHHAGTAMRFLTAYFAIQPGREVVLTGSPRMKERPIKVLADALRTLGAQIDYLEKEGYPPLKITGREIAERKVSLKADVSSQYITALILIAAKLKSGLELTLEGEITSKPYIDMTLGLLKEVGMTAGVEGNIITVKPAEVLTNNKITVESDWSSASYFYSLIALSAEGTQITLSSYKKDSLQGDSVLAGIYKSLGVETTFSGNEVTLHKTNLKPEALHFNLNNMPDIAQTITVTCFGLGIGCHLTGLHTLKIKETDRLEALQAELKKLGADVLVTDDSLTLQPTSFINSNVAIDTYNDHRMAMAFAPLALKIPVIINDVGVVSKSYPAFWNDLKAVGISMETL